jgi:hypothetical protein
VLYNFWNDSLCSIVFLPVKILSRNDFNTDNSKILIGDGKETGKIGKINEGTHNLKDLSFSNSSIVFA